MSYVTPYVCIVLLQPIYRGVSDHTVLLLRSVDDCICANCSLERNILRGVLASVLPFPIVVLVDFHKYNTMPWPLALTGITRHTVQYNNTIYII